MTSQGYDLRTLEIIKKTVTISTRKTMNLATFDTVFFTSPNTCLHLCNMFGGNYGQALFQLYWSMEFTIEFCSSIVAKEVLFLIVKMAKT
jgi:hypothetical protein